MDCTIDELRAVFLARDLHDGELGACGLAAHVPLAAMRLAQMTHAPNLQMVLEGGVNPTPPYLIDAPVDPRAHDNVEYVSDLFDMFINAERGLDVWFMTGIQTDRFGNVNLHAVGDRQRPKLRGPGVGTASYAVTCDRWYNYPRTHTPRSFVRDVDFVTGLGNDPRRRSAGAGRGCRFIVTPLGVLDFDTAGTARLRHVHPGVSVEEVVAATGFDLPVPDDVTTTPAPTIEELDILRRVIDTRAALRRS